MHAQSIAATPVSRLFATSGNAHRGLDDTQTLGVTLDSRALLRGHKIVTIVHNGASYRLQATRLGKLILTK